MKETELTNLMYELLSQKKIQNVGDFILSCSTDTSCALK